MSLRINGIDDLDIRKAMVKKTILQGRNAVILAGSIYTVVAIITVASACGRQSIRSIA